MCHDCTLQLVFTQSKTGYFYQKAAPLKNGGRNLRAKYGNNQVMIYEVKTCKQL